MLIEKINLHEIAHLTTERPEAPIVEDFFNYFSNFNLERVLIVTDEDVRTDIRVLNQLAALQRTTKNITILKVKPDNNYTDSQKKDMLKALHLKTLKNIIYLPWFFILVVIHHPFLAFRNKAKQGIYNDHSYSLTQKIDTSSYTCVICNNLISTSSVDSHSEVDYIYDIHELEVFRNRNKASIQRSFYIYLKEMEELRKRENIITISKYIADTLSTMYNLRRSKIKVIYNKNFFNTNISFDSESKKDKYLLIYIGNVSIDRGLDDIARLSYKYDILIIACNYNEEAISYLENNSNLYRLTIFKGMDYQSILLKKIRKYQYPFFLILINPNHPSYRYALPNKFFQAQAVECPIIVYDKTYLGSIVKKYGCGLIFSDITHIDFLNSISNIEYVAMQQAMKVKIAEAIEDKNL